MKLLPGLLVSSGLALAQGAAGAAEQDAGPHQHGVARLQIQVEGKVMDLRLRAPLDSLLGFETTPRTQKQRQAVKRMAAQLHRPQGLFVPTAQADCAPTGVTLASERIKPELLSADAGAPAPATVNTVNTVNTAAAPVGGKAAGKAHADLEATISFQCNRPQSLTGLQVKMFDAFPALRQIDTEIVTPMGHSGTRLSADRTGLTW